MRPRTTQKITRPIFPSVRSLRTSQSPFPRLRQYGIPIGQPNSTFCTSRPTRWRSSDESPLIQSLTGWLPTGVSKKNAGSFLERSITGYCAKLDTSCQALTSMARSAFTRLGAIQQVQILGVVGLRAFHHRVSADYQKLNRLFHEVPQYAAVI
jgi:hypothetical protein